MPACDFVPSIQAVNHSSAELGIAPCAHFQSHTAYVFVSCYQPSPFFIFLPTCQSLHILDRPRSSQGLHAYQNPRPKHVPGKAQTRGGREPDIASKEPVSHASPLLSNLVFSGLLEVPRIRLSNSPTTQAKKRVTVRVSERHHSHRASHRQLLTAHKTRVSMQPLHRNCVSQTSSLGQMGTCI